jgi:hypothetical protein
MLDLEHERHRAVGALDVLAERVAVVVRAADADAARAERRILGGLDRAPGIRTNAAGPADTVWSRPWTSAGSSEPCSMSMNTQSNPAIWTTSATSRDAVVSRMPTSGWPSRNR